MTTATYKEDIVSIRGYADESSLSNILMKKKWSEMNNKEVKLKIEALGRGVHGITIQELTEDDSEDEWAQEIEAQLLEELSDDEMQEVDTNEQAKEAWSGKTNKEIKLEIEALSHGAPSTNVRPGTREDSGDGFARQVEAQLLEELCDYEMQDTGSKTKTHAEVIDEAWAAFEAAVAEDPSVIPKRDPKLAPHVLRMPQFRMRERDIADDLAVLSTEQAKFIINLNVCFDVSNLPRYRQSQNMHYDIDAQDAPTVKALLSTLWKENHEWLVFEWYTLEHLRRVHRLEVTLPIIEDNSVKDALSWSIKGDFNAQEQQTVWKDFLETAEKRGRIEALDHQRKVDLQEKRKRLRCVKDHLGNFYDSNGDYWRPRKWLVHAQVEAKIVLYFD
ncbi:hypothetical protein GJ744_008207 [Endocarpon pusillum]|uniref:Uncharacterized protein n=1 Tax=Endocarpon pusillum TaxID=364733 RepID=A0A8H7AHP7_9EURO|nr:hypothetical protein GJ744_008207 [Endocarpon pusillum]